MLSCNGRHRCIWSPSARSLRARPSLHDVHQKESTTKAHKVAIEENKVSAPWLAACPMRLSVLLGDGGTRDAAVLLRCCSLLWPASAAAATAAAATQTIQLSISCSYRNSVVGGGCLDASSCHRISSAQPSQHNSAAGKRQLQKRDGSQVLPSPRRRRQQSITMRPLSAIYFRVDSVAFHMSSRG